MYIYNEQVLYTDIEILLDVKMKLEKEKCGNVVSKMTFRLP